MYVDDGQLTDLAEAEFEGQMLVHDTFEACGARLAENKRRWMAKEGDFLGVIHDFSRIEKEGAIEFEPRKELQEKLKSMVQTFLKENYLTPAEASKFRGTQGFMNTALFGQLSKAAVREFILRQYVHQPPWTLSDALRRACEFYEAIMLDIPRRVMKIRQHTRKPLVVASDAQVEKGEPPGAGYIIWDPEDGSMRGAYYKHGEKELSVLGTSQSEIESGRQPIARCECAVLPTALYSHAECFADRDVLWFVDNTVALAGIVKGTSKEPVNEKLIGRFWMAAFRLRARIWVEYIDSKGNWADGISRKFEHDEFVREHQVEVRDLQHPFSWFKERTDEAWEASKGLHPAGA
jgi:hypothetical protein